MSGPRFDPLPRCPNLRKSPAGSRPRRSGRSTQEDTCPSFRSSYGERAVRRSLHKGGLPMPPARRVAVLACMDARLDPARALGLEEGDAHVIRNAGGRADDAMRSLVISQQLLGTREIVVIHHTDCGMLTFTDEQLPPQGPGDARAGDERRRSCPSPTSTRASATMSRSCARRGCSCRTCRSAASCTTSGPDACKQSALSGARRRVTANVRTR